MRVGGQRHDPDALRLGKTRHPMYRRLGGPQEGSGRVWKISAPNGIRSPDLPTHCESQNLKLNEITNLMRHCAGFISAGSLYMFRASSSHHQEYLKLVQRPLVHVLSLQVSHHISLLGPPALIRCDDLPATITHVPVAAVLV